MVAGGIDQRMFAGVGKIGQGDLWEGLRLVKLSM